MVEIVAIDGPASVGKSSLAKISNHYKSPMLSSGKLYRAVALKIINKKINLNNKQKIMSCALSLKEVDTKSNKLFSSDVDQIASKISAKKYLREQLMSFQREFPKRTQNKKFAIIEGRDIGTKIFPMLSLKSLCGQTQKLGRKEGINKLKKRAKKQG